MRESKILGVLKKGFCAYITDPDDMRYYSGFDGEGAVIISENGKYILTDGRYTQRAKRCGLGYEVKETVNHIKFIKDNNLSIMFQPESFSFLKYSKFKANSVNMEPFHINTDILRREKDSEEIKCLKTAAQIAQGSLEELIPFIKEGVSERELASRLDFICGMKGSEKPSFETIFLAGKNTGMPHGVPSDYRIKNKDFVTIDFGCVYKGYHSDMTRTFAVGGADDKMRHVYETVRKAQDEAQNAIKPGANGKDIDKIARDIISKEGYGKNFNHSTGHGVGLKIHEFPVLSPGADTVLKKGDVVTCEPGIYLEEEFGVRIENTVIVEENGAASLQNMTRKLIIL